MSWENIIFLTAAIHGLIISTFFLIKEDSLKHKALGIFLLTFSITILHYVNFWTQSFNFPTYIRWIFPLSSWLVAPSLYFYFKGKIVRHTLLYHLVVPLLFLLFWWTMTIHPVDPEFFSYSRPVLVTVKTTFFLYYGWLMLRISAGARNARFLLVPYSLFTLSIPFYYLSLRLGFYTLELDYLVCGAFVLLTYGLTYFSEFDLLRSKTSKYATSSLTEDEGRMLVEKIKNSLSEHLYFRDPDFSLTSFAEKINVPKYRISQALNSYADTSFTELVNTYRVQMAKEKLQCRSTFHLKLESIGEEVGFRNKVSFYKHFKRMVGQSPGEFREMYVAHQWVD